jgi:colicin import membrane protein
LPAPTATEQGAPQDTTEATPPPEAIAEPIDKPKPKIPDKPKPQQFSLDNLSALIDRSKKKAGNNSNATAPTAPPGTKPREGFGAQNAMTATIKDYLAAKIGVCWRDVKDMPNPERLIVTVHVTLGRDGNLTTQPRVTSFVAPGDTYMRVAADNAARAVRLCGPYELPQDSYSVWRELDLKFGPKGLQ